MPAELTVPWKMAERSVRFEQFERGVLVDADAPAFPLLDAGEAADLVGDLEAVFHVVEFRVGVFERGPAATHAQPSEQEGDVGRVALHRGVNRGRRGDGHVGGRVAASVDLRHFIDFEDAAPSAFTVAGRTHVTVRTRAKARSRRAFKDLRAIRVSLSDFKWVK